MNTLDLKELYLAGYYLRFSDAVKKGYSGVGIYSKSKPDKIITKMELDWADDEGRYIEIIVDDLHIISTYFPSGSSGDLRQDLKYEFMSHFEKFQLADIISKKKSAVICGDINIVHTEKDIKNWRSNQKNSGCLPQEREWLEHCFSNLGFLDAFRQKNNNHDEYSWWSNRGRAWENNVGWRIDYQILSPNFELVTDKVKIYKEQRFSDHAPCIFDYI